MSGRLAMGYALRGYKTVAPLARKVYVNRKKYIKRYKNTKRRYKKLRADLRGIGETIGVGTAKRTTTYNQTPADMLARTMYVREITAVQGATNLDVFDRIDQRQRDIINLRGFKMCVEMQNTTGRPLLFNWAVISPKGVEPGFPQAANQDQKPANEDGIARNLSAGEGLDATGNGLFQDYPNFFRENGASRGFCF
jgi:hypothetical protein